ncbi:hypothetical protein CARUB_v10011853mg [Capsella rubella]|uniref:CASP-like protein n=1 Tax=Capsella rubella TaxID=81985 RepID=R0GKY4_9BRAS|nr:uncharacterized protein LOC17897817 [Capsella rubella]EOA36617.1 hypothetical protein CARUB_v10011853mg [Capsella rubella]
MEEGNKTGKKGCFCVTITVCIVLIVGLDIVAGYVGLQAEVAQQDVKHNRVWMVECKAPSNTAFTLGIIAVSCLAAAHVIANVIGCSISSLLPTVGGVTKTITANLYIICLGLNWLAGLAAAGALAMGIWSNRESRTECGFTNKHYLSIGSYLSFVHAFVSVVYYVSSIVA